jgi:cyclic pyranopterin phosphate synthase
MTTNATRIHAFIDQVIDAGITYLNVSLDTLQSDRFLLVTRRDQFSLVKSNIDLLISKGIHVKVNCVVMRGLNDGEINDFIEWTRHTPVEVRFIEFMPFTGNHWSSNKVFTLQEILDTVRTKYEVVADYNDITDTAKKYHVPGHLGRFAVISTMSEPFCSGCNRMRLTADGKLKNCLFSKHETDLLTPLRMGEPVLPLIHQCILDKAKELGGQFDSNFGHLHAEDIDNRSMITIGG